MTTKQESDVVLSSWKERSRHPSRDFESLSPLISFSNNSIFEKDLNGRLRRRSSTKVHRHTDDHTENALSDLPSTVEWTPRQDSYYTLPTVLRLGPVFLRYVSYGKVSVVPASLPSSFDPGREVYSLSLDRSFQGHPYDLYSYFSSSTFGLDVLTLSSLTIALLLYPVSPFHPWTEDLPWARPRLLRIRQEESPVSVEFRSRVLDSRTRAEPTPCTLRTDLQRREGAKRNIERRKSM